MRHLACQACIQYIRGNQTHWSSVLVDVFGRRLGCVDQVFPAFAEVSRGLNRKSFPVDASGSQKILIVVVQSSDPIGCSAFRFLVSLVAAFGYGLLPGTIGAHWAVERRKR